MKKIVYLSSILTLSLALCSCSYAIELEGRVLSNETEEPISGALVTLTSKNITVTTDSLGFFHLRTSAPGKVPRRTFSIKKEGYKDFEVEFTITNSESTTIVKRGLKNYDYGGTRFYYDSTNLSRFRKIIWFDKYSKDYARRGNSVIFYMDIDDDKIDFKKFLDRHRNEWWGDIDRYMIK